jgi:glycerophosphoryl diester phosphodiesterase
VDGCAVLDHDGTVRRGLRSRRISEVHRDELPPHIPDLTTVLGMTGVATQLSLDIKDTDALPSVVAAIAASGVDPARVWLCSPDLGFLLELTAAMPVVRAVHSTRVRSLDVSLEKHCSLLSESGVAALNLHHSEWTGGMTTLAHRFGLHAFAWDIQYPEQMVNILRMGMDAVYSDHADMMMRCIGDING